MASIRQMEKQVRELNEAIRIAKAERQAKLQLTCTHPKTKTWIEWIQFDAVTRPYEDTKCQCTRCKKFL